MIEWLTHGLVAFAAWLLSNAEALYWATGTLVVLGGLAIFLGETAHHIWTRRFAAPHGAPQAAHYPRHSRSHRPVFHDLLAARPMLMIAGSQESAPSSGDDRSKSIHRCESCGAFLEVAFVRGEGWRRQTCQRCGAEPSGSPGANGEPQTVLTESQPDGTVIVAGPEGGYHVKFIDPDAAGTHYALEVLLCEATYPPLPESGGGYISWAGEGYIVVDQDVASGTHVAAWMRDSGWADDDSDVEEFWHTSSFRRHVADVIYRVIYGEEDAYLDIPPTH